MLHRLISQSAALALVFLTTLVAQQDIATHKRAMSLRDVMQFQQLRSPVLSSSGAVVAYEARPDRGDGESIVHVLDTGKVWRVSRGTQPVIATGDRWLRATVIPPFVPESKQKQKDAAKIQPALALVDLGTGDVELIDRVRSAAFAEDGSHVAWLHHAPDKNSDKNTDSKSERTRGTNLILRQLPDQGAASEDVTIENVTRFVFSPDSRFLSFVVCTPDGDNNGLFHRDLETGRVQGEVFTKSVVSAVAWNEAATQFACTVAPQTDDGEKGRATVWVADTGATRRKYPAITSDSFGPEWVLHADTTLRWSKNGKRLHFGVRAKAMEDQLASLKPKPVPNSASEDATGESTAAEASSDVVDLFDFDALLEGREVDVWHYRDALINPNQKKVWSQVSKRVYACVFDLDADAPLRLADTAMPDVTIPDGSAMALGRSDVPYQRETTWDGRYSDVYVVDVKTGSRVKVLERHSGAVSLSPRGSYLVWYDEGRWFLRDNGAATTRELTAKLEVPFADEDHDYPRSTPGYGVAGWYGDESAVLIYDKFDVWRFEPKSGGNRCVTRGRGRASGRKFRIVDLDPEAEPIDVTAGPLLLTGFDTDSKGWGFWSVRENGPVLLVEATDRFRFVAKAKDAARLLYTREDYDRFPDLHVSDLDLGESTQVTSFDDQRAPFLWGTSELIEWQSQDGRRIQGAVIKPGDYDPGRRYPVLVYYYRFFSQRVHEWNSVVVNHRPCFPYWASNGYVVFLPDIRFDIGYPGHSATKCLVPGIAKLVELGIADAKAVALHGHSWSGYQSAHVITETNIFACAIAGAPVSNMTSAYGGVRWGSGKSRQFQYEKTQSRIGGSLWTARDKYIQNSPVFFADKIETPLLIQFGDEDGAVPWYQGIELYMAMRRLDKPCVFLQYRGEPHHLQKYANKLDYTIRFKEYVDHYCRGKPAPEWITSGVPYAGK